MSATFQGVLWNRQKQWYDGTLAALLLLGLAGYGAVIGTLHPNTTFETFVIRFTALSALILLHVILAIGPLCRLNRNFFPLLYNRRHLGVTMFFLGLVHGGFSIFQFHGVGDANPIVSAYTAYATDYWVWWNHPMEIGQFPFEVFGLAALIILFVMAATSHDFWLKYLGASVWKTLHTGVYVAYAFLICHVALGALQSERSPVYVILLGVGFFALATLHVLAWMKRGKAEKLREDGYIDAGPADELKEGIGKVVWVGGRAVALFRHKGRAYALSNVCRHQGGPLGEGRIIYDCITCPWHAYQYRAEDGCSPPPFTEVVPTYHVALADDRIFIHPQEKELESKSEGVELPEILEEAPDQGDFYIGWQKTPSPQKVKFLRWVVGVLAIGVPCLMAVIAWLQNPVEGGGYEFGVERTFTGDMVADPIPLLHLDSGGQNLVLVGSGKFALPADLLKKGDGKHVQLTGSLLYWKNMVMLEVNQPEATKVLGDSATVGLHGVVLGDVTLTGELVDTKCYFGAMRPAVGKVHRGCAIRCLSGGVPPGLLVRDSSGNGYVVMLAGEQGEKLEFNIEWAARPVEASGSLELYGNTLVLRADSLNLVHEDEPK